MRSGFPTFLWVGQTFHLAVEARGTASEMLADVCVRRLGRMLGHTHQVGIRRTVDRLWIGKRLRQTRPPDSKELSLVNTSALQATCSLSDCPSQCHGLESSPLSWWLLGRVFCGWRR